MAYGGRSTFDNCSLTDNFAAVGVLAPREGPPRTLMDSPLPCVLPTSASSQP